MFCLLLPSRSVVCWPRREVIFVTVPEAVELFENEMKNEVFNSCCNDLDKDALVEAVKKVAQTVINTYNAERKTK